MGCGDRAQRFSGVNVDHIVLHLESPLMAFGGEVVDNIGVIRRFPSASMLTGLVANALGWNRTEGLRHERLQDRLVFAARIDREPATVAPLRDFQTAQLGASDRGWTTRGVPEARAGGQRTYDAPHLRYRDYFADMLVTVAFRLEPPDDDPDLELVTLALQEPSRPLFIGRKPCLPSAPLFAGLSVGETALDALRSWPLADGTSDSTGPEGGPVAAMWPADDSPAWVRPTRTHTLADRRNWGSSGLHGGGRQVCEGPLDRDGFATTVERRSDG